MTNTTQKKTLNDLREYFPLADSYLDSLALAGKLPECNYPSNGVPELRDDLPPASIEDIVALAMGEKRG